MSFFLTDSIANVVGLLFYLKKNAFVDVEHNVISDQKGRHIALDISIC